MKFLGMLAGIFLGFLTVANAQTTPSLYCVSTKVFNNGKTWPVNQFNIFTNSSGTLKMSLQFHAWGQSEEEDATITTDNLLTITKLTFDENTQEIRNGSGKFVMTLGKEISSRQANAILGQKKVSFSFEDPAGMLARFKKYRLATVTQFEYPGVAKKWSSTLKEGFEAGVNEYVCGDIKDITK